MGGAPRGSARPGGFWFLLAASMFFLSGATGLVFEVVWVRLLVNVFGATVLAVTTVLAAFMAGLALGSYAVGRTADRSTRPLVAYGVLVAGTGLAALAVPALVRLAQHAYPALPEAITRSFWLLSVARFGWCALVLLVPTVLMGGTLPMLTKWSAGAGLSVGRAAGLLYGVNTFGAVLGAAVGGFYLIPSLGLSASIAIAAFLSLAVGSTVVVLGLRRREPPPEPHTSAGTAGPERPREGSPRSEPPEMTARLVLLLVAIAGFCSLAYEVLWTRVLIVFLPSTTFAFTTMLTTFLLGIAVGSSIVTRLVDRLRSPSYALAAIEAGIAACGVASLTLFARFPRLAESLSGSAESWMGVVRAEFLLSVAIMIVPTLLMGAAFPLAVRIQAANARVAGRSVGSVYAANTAGCILGSFVAGFLLVPVLGIQASIILIAAANLAIGLVLLSRARVGLRQKAALAAGAATAFALLIVVAPLGRHLAVSPIAEQYRPGSMNVIFYDEGVTATLTVTENVEPRELGFFIDRWPVVGTSHDGMRTVKLLGYLPAAAARSARDVAVIGYGMGMTTWTLALSSEVERIDVIELAEGVIEASPFFASLNHNVLDDPRVHLTIGDGRNFLLTTDRTYDVISCDPIHPTLGSGALYTRDFFELARNHLKPGGAFVQYLPYHKLSREDFGTLVRTFQSVFPHASIWNGAAHAVLLGTVDPPVFDVDRLNRMLETNPRLREELAVWGLGDPSELLACHMLNAAQAAALAGPGPLNSDDRPRIEFSEPRSHGRNTMIENMSVVLEHGFSPPEYVFAGTREEQAAFAERLARCLETRELVGRAIVSHNRRNSSDAARWIEAALERSPGDVDALAFARMIAVPFWQKEAKELAAAGRFEEALGLHQKITDLDPTNASAAAECGIAYARADRQREAIPWFERALELDPGMIQPVVWLAVACEQIGDVDGAARWYLTLAAREDAGVSDLWRGAEYLAEHGRHEAAAVLARRVVELAPERADAAVLLGDCYMASGRLADAVGAWEKALSLEPGNARLRRGVEAARRLLEEGGAR